MNFKLQIFDDRRDDDAYDCPGVREGALEPTRGRVSRFRFLKKLHILFARQSRFCNDLNQGIFNVINRFIEQPLLGCCRIDITLKAVFHCKFSFRCEDSKKVSIFKGVVCDFLYIYSKLEI